MCGFGWVSYRGWSWSIVYENTLAGIHRNTRHWGRLGDVDDAHTVIVDRQPLLPYAVHLLRLMDFDMIDELVHHSRRQLPCAGILSDGGDEHIRCDCP